MLVRARHLQGGLRCVSADARQEDDRQPAVDRRDVDAEHLCRPDRMVPPQLRLARQDDAVAPGEVPAWRRPSWPTWRAPTGRSEEHTSELQSLMHTSNTSYS